MSQVVAKGKASRKQQFAATQKDELIIRSLNELIQKHNADLQSFVIESSDFYLQKNEYASIIKDSVSNEIPVCIINIICDLVWHPFDLLDFLDSITRFHDHNSLKFKCETDVPCKIIYNDKDKCFLHFWREKDSLEFDLEIRRQIMKDKVELTESNLYSSTFPKKIRSRGFCKEAVELMSQQLFDCCIVRIPEPDWRLQNIVQLSDVLIVGVSPNGNYVGFNCGFHGKDVFNHNNE